LRSFAPAMPPATLPTEVGITIFHGISVLKMYIAADIAERGSIKAIAVAWLLWAEMPRNFSMAGTATVPPPLPKTPFAKPVNMPISIGVRRFKNSLLCGLML